MESGDEYLLTITHEEYKQHLEPLIQRHDKLFNNLVRTYDGDIDIELRPKKNLSDREGRVTIKISLLSRTGVLKITLKLIYKHNTSLSQWIDEKKLIINRKRLELEEYKRR
jgi:hypothetical protein